MHCDLQMYLVNFLPAAVENIFFFKAESKACLPWKLEHSPEGNPLLPPNVTSRCRENIINTIKDLKIEFLGYISAYATHDIPESLCSWPDSGANYGY